ncbi:MULTISPECIES: LysE family translocator [Sulfurospirillum]|jgi:threonine/homoserine/homoserine lactone efflux protein|uniref:LysE family translocator n=1 Tax=Sulfurospirillum cavolei TaxID=366522 RepID=A0A2D3WDJ0_9BACT|nr:MULTISPECIES: LysE family translocator [Sulfurospirillum]MCP3652093.1 LysE family translocator [Sulfurospirillum sp. DNRA8]MCR1810941.1 LysE family translocator [Sulfurospirillum sp. DNRA8]MDY0263773.1 LysE family translocator [Sulfurospirillum cavolei]DAB37150.1 MAG TPA: LysE family translocator [Sulfurospirillum cavolei]
MFGTHDLWLFVVSGLLLNMTPGADTFYILSHASSRGFKGGLAAALGISTGCMVHIVAASVGLSALLVASATAFTVVKVIGALYLLYLGFKMIFQSASLVSSQRARFVSFQTIFWQGCLTNALNPKVALFFLAFLPQFVDQQAQYHSLSMLFLGVVFNVNGTLWNILIAWSATLALQKLTSDHFAIRWFHKTVGVLFLFLGLKLLLDEH